MSLPTPMKPLHPNVNLRKARSTILHLLLARPSSVPFTLSNISTFMSSASGLDKSLMIIQYPAKIAVALLVALAAKLAKENVGKGLAAGTLVGREALRSRAALYAVRLKALSSSIGDARTMMRLLGIIPVLASVPSLLSSASSLDPTSHLINILQTVSLILYYPLENLSYLSSKGVFPLSPARELNWSTWSCRFWAAYVALDVWRLARQRKQMQLKERAIRMKSQGEEKEDVVADVKALRAEKVGWIEEAVVNVGYAPLTIHWSLPSGAWSNEAWTGVFGTIACLAGIRAKWRNMS